jgi:hypothetical protein
MFKNYPHVSADFTPYSSALFGGIAFALFIFGEGFTLRAFFEHYSYFLSMNYG